MEQERNEVYERIPWDSLRAESKDRQWLLYVVAGAIVVGALAYSYMSNRPPQQVAVAEPQVADTQAPISNPAPPPPVVAADPVEPMVVAEADLYAIDPERLHDAAEAHAEWFVAEFFTVDASGETSILAGLLPSGLPAVPGDSNTKVFVEWVRSLGAEEISPLRYRVPVLVRSLAAGDDGVYQRQMPFVAVVDVEVGESGPKVVLPPAIEPAPEVEPADPALTTVPEDVVAAIVDAYGEVEILGGMPEEGAWRVVVLAPDPAGVTRPLTVVVPT